MKVAIILSGNLDIQPYVRYFTDVFDSLLIDYEYICWDRDYSNPITINNHEIYSYRRNSSIKNKRFLKLYDYYLFSQFVINHLKKYHYDFLIVHTITNAVFLKNFLIKNFKQKYIFDIRDYSPIFVLTKKYVTQLVSHSTFTTISSSGFLTWLPNSNKYVISHNVAMQYLEESQFEHELFKGDKINILTIGQIRDYVTNKRLIVDLGNKDKIRLIFAGYGIEKDNIEKFALNSYSNVYFLGKYIKEDESHIVQNADFIYIVLPTDILSSTLMSNRFYLSIVHRKPMIVNEESAQASFVKKFNLGIIVKSDDNIQEKLFEYINSFDFVAFNQGCIDVIEVVKEDITVFKNSIINYFKYARK